jgi:hypothetical protein
MVRTSLQFSTLLLLCVDLLSAKSSVSAWRPSPRPILSPRLTTKRARSNVSRKSKSTPCYNYAAVWTRGGASPAVPPVSHALPVSFVPNLKAIAIWTAAFTLFLVVVTSSTSLLSFVNSLAILCTGWTLAFFWFFFSIFASDPGTPAALAQSTSCLAVSLLALVGGYVGALEGTWTFVIPVILWQLGFLALAQAVAWYRKSRPS